MNVVFYLSAAVAILATGMVITRTNAMHALLNLVVSFLAVSLMFFTLGAPFIAALEVIVYAGAIMVLFIFAIMLLNLGSEQKSQDLMRGSGGSWAVAGVLALVLLAELVYVIANGAANGVPSAGLPTQAGIAVEPKQVGTALFSTYLIGVELASILLLSSVIGAYHLGLARREEVEIPREKMVEFKETAVREGEPEAAPGGDGQALEAEKER